MKKISFYFLLGLILFSFMSCNHNTDSESQEETVIVLLKSVDTTTIYELIDQEGEIYKSGKIYNDETITINHFKKGTYNLRYSNIHNSTYYRTATIEITKACSITFNRDSYSIK